MPRPAAARLDGGHYFFGWPGIGAMPDGGHHGEGEHDQRHMPMPAMPRAGLVVIEAEFVLGGFKAVFDGPAMAFDRYQLFHGHALGAPRREERKVAVGCQIASNCDPLFAS